MLIITLGTICPVFNTNFRGSVSMKQTTVQKIALRFSDRMHNVRTKICEIKTANESYFMLLRKSHRFFTHKREEHY